MPGCPLAVIYAGAQAASRGRCRSICRGLFSRAPPQALEKEKKRGSGKYSRKVEGRLDVALGGVVIAARFPGRREQISEHCEMSEAYGKGVADSNSLR